MSHNECSLQKYLNGDYYNNIQNISKSVFQNAVWNLGSVGNYAITAKNYYNTEKLENNPPNVWLGKIALIYVSDYGFAVGGTTSNRNNCLNVSIGGGWDNGQNTECYLNNWLFNTSKNRWTLTHYGDQAYRIQNSGGVWHVYLTNVEQVYPTLYLKSNVKITEGLGTSSSPFQLSEN